LFLFLFLSLFLFLFLLVAVVVVVVVVSPCEINQWRRDTALSNQSGVRAVSLQRASNACRSFGGFTNLLTRRTVAHLTAC
jgi:hypothetical protein